MMARTKQSKTKEEVFKKEHPTTPTFGEFGEVEGYLSSMIIGSEYALAKANNDQEYSDFEALIDKIEGIRSEKHVDWMSDIKLGYLLSHLLTECSEWSQQYFMTRDFVEVYLEGSAQEDKDKCLACKTLLNKTMNMRGVYHFQKYIRSRIINWMFGQCYKIYFWEKEVRETKQPQPATWTNVPAIDDEGNAISKTIKVEQPPQTVRKLLKDRVNYEVIDPRNVFTDFKYTYSAQGKDWIIIRSETNLEQMKQDQESFGYINLDVVEAKLSDTNIETTTSRETYNKTQPKTTVVRTPIVNFDLLDRYGKIWAIVEERDEDDGTPSKIIPGQNSTGGVLEKAKLVEAIVSYAIINGSPVLVRFQPTWAVDCNGNTYKPITRSWNYIHPTKDLGLSDGKNLREIDTAIDDTFNISNVRVLLATLPTLKGKKSSLEENPTVYIEPEHIIELEDPEHDLMEMVIRDNMDGAGRQINQLTGFGSSLDAIWPTTQGSPDKSNVTATAIAGAESRTNMRGSYKSLTYEYTDLTEGYWIVNQMTHRFAEQETMEKLLGKKLMQVYDPDGDYTYVPLSQSMEAEHNKVKKIQNWDQLIGRLSGLAKVAPKEIIPMIAVAVGEIAKLLGMEYRDIADKLKVLEKANPPNPEAGKGAEQTEDGKPIPAQNQLALPQPGMEQGARGGMNLVKRA